MEFVSDKDIHDQLIRLRPGESIDADGMSRILRMPWLNVSLDYRLELMVRTGHAAYDSGETSKWYVAGPKLKEEKHGTSDGLSR